MTEVIAKTTMHRISCEKWEQIHSYLEETDWNKGSNSAYYGSVTGYMRTEYMMFVRENNVSGIVYECYNDELLTLFLLKWS